MILITLPDEQATEKLTKICELLTDMVMEDWLALDGKRSHRPKMPGRDTLPEGHCTFEYACNNPIKHWRYMHDDDMWIPVCRSHRP